MNVLLENIAETQRLEIPHWAPMRTQGRSKKYPTYLTSVYSDQELYDNIKMEGTSPSITKEEIPMESIYNEISTIRVDVDKLKTEVSEIKANVNYLRKDMDELKGDVKSIATEKLPVIQTDIAVIRNNGEWLKWISIAILGSLVAGIILYFYTNMGS